MNMTNVLEDHFQHYFYIKYRPPAKILDVRQKIQTKIYDSSYNHQHLFYCMLPVNINIFFLILPSFAAVSKKKLPIIHSLHYPEAVFVTYISKNGFLDMCRRFKINLTNDPNHLVFMCWGWQWHMWLELEMGNIVFIFEFNSLLITLQIPVW